jgi:hypothetical protein
MLKVTHQQEVEEVTKRVREEETKKLEEAQHNWESERGTLPQFFFFFCSFSLSLHLSLSLSIFFHCF